MRYSAYAAGGLAALLLAAALVIPLVIDTPRVSAQIQQKISAAAEAEVRWDAFSIRVLPRPRAVLGGLSVKAQKLSLGADAAQVDLSLLPLLLGRVEISTVSVRHPVVRIDLSPQAALPAARPAAGQPFDPVALHRQILETLRRVLPRAVISVEEGELYLGGGDMPPLDAHQVTLHANSDERGLQVEATASGRNWDRLALSSRLGYDDLSTDTTLEAVGLRPQAWLDWSFSASPIRVGMPNATVKAHLRGGAGKPLECEVSAEAGVVEAVSGARRVRVEGIRVGGVIRAQTDEISVHTDELRIGASLLGVGEFRYGLKNGSLAGAAGYELDLAQILEYARALAPKEAEAALARVRSASGRLHGRVTLVSAGDAWSVGVVAEKSDARVQVQDLPGPVTLTGVSVSLSPKAVKVDRAALKLLDASVVASATVGDFERGPRIQGSLAESTLGPDLLAWLWQTAKLPPSLALKAPIRLTVPRLAWVPKGPLEVQASAAFDAGPLVAVDLSWSPGALNLRRAAVTDKLSNAAVSLSSKGSMLEGRYSGRLDSRSVGAILAGATALTGAITGDMRVTYDTTRTRRTTATGALKGEKIDLSWLAGRPASVERIDLSADGDTLRIAEATVDWAGQRATLRGELKRTASGPVVDAQIDSPGVVVDALLPPKKEEAVKQEKKEKSALWPLPVTGRVALRSDFIQVRHLKVAPVVATLVLEPQRAHAELKEGVLCGISLPFTLEATPNGVSAATQIRAAKQPVDQVVPCLSNEKIQITGTLDLKADLRTQGELPQLVRNLQGTVDVEVRNGTVKKFALLGNILSMQNVVALALQGGPKLDAEGFPFRQLHAAGRFEKGRFELQEGVFHSNAIGFGADGWISLTDFQCRLTVLVAPLAIANEVMSKLPVLGYVVGGALTSLPVGVSGDIRDPVVVPLGPGAITSELMGIFTRTITLPKKLVPPAGQK